MIIGQIALIQESKRQDFVLDIISKLIKRGVDAIGLFPGEVREPEFLEFLKEKSKKLEISDRVLFLGRRNDIPDLLKIIDILIIPSFEGFPLAGLEAISAKVPVVACDRAGAKEFIEVSCSGATYIENNIDDAIKAIEKVIQNKELIIEKGYEFALKSSNESYKEKIKNTFASVL